MAASARRQRSVAAGQLLLRRPFLGGLGLRLGDRLGLLVGGFGLGLLVDLGVRLLVDGGLGLLLASRLIGLVDGSFGGGAGRRLLGQLDLGLRHLRSLLL